MSRPAASKPASDRDALIGDTMEAERWADMMRRGAFEEAWRLSDLAIEHGSARRTDLPRHEQLVWAGAPLEDRRVLIRSYHGLGDAIQFIRYVPRVCARAREVAVWIQAPLIPLLRTMGVGVRWMTLTDGRPHWRFEVDVELMELPHVFRTSAATIPSNVPYLHPPPLADRPDHRLRVGVAWMSGEWNPERSIPAAALAPLWELDGLAWYGVQPGLAPMPAAVRPWPRTSVLALARFMQRLDLVVTVDTMAAHLAGSLGVRVWTLLPHEADWRWMEARDDSPWYPTMRLVRQTRRGRWSDVIETVRAGLEEDVRSRLIVERRGERGDGQAL